MRHGFDRFYGIPYSNDMNPLHLYDQETIVQTFPNAASQAPLTRMLVEQAVAFIRASKDEPFFAYIPQPQPHEPLASEFAGRSAGGAHGDSVEEIDHYVGVILDELTALGIRENTIVIFTSDNGPWFVGSPGDLYGRKVETYEGGMRVPMLVEWPAAIPRGRVYDEPMVNVDWLPTFAAACGFELDPSRIIDGTSMLPALTNPGTKVDRGDVFYYDDTSTGGNLNAVRRGEWKCMRRRANGPYFTARGFSATEETPQLFNLRRDPSESYDLSAHHPEITEQLLARMTEFDTALRADAAARRAA
jgi:arylsulfatase A-like enzyme